MLVVLKVLLRSKGGYEPLRHACMHVLKGLKVKVGVGGVGCG